MDNLPTLVFASDSSADLTDDSTADTNFVRVDTNRLISSRLLIQANSGGGKSRALRSLLEQTHGVVQHIVFDPEGEFASLRERFPYVLAGKEGGEVPASPQTAKLLCRRLMELGVSAVLDLYELPLAERRRFVRLFLEELMALPREMWRPLLVVIDEAHVFCPERGAGEAESTEAVIALCTQGRKRGYCAVLATQRIAKLHKDAAAELLNKMIGRTSLDIDLRRASDELGLDKEQKGTLRSLNPGSFYTYGPAIYGESGITLVQTASVWTTHPESGYVTQPPPPTPDSLRVLIEQFSDFPKEAVQEINDLSAALNRIKEMERLLQSTPPVERIIERRVDVPVFRDGEVERLTALSNQFSVIAMQIQQFADVLKNLQKTDTVPSAKAVEQSVKAERVTENDFPNEIIKEQRVAINLSNPQQRIFRAVVSFDEIGVHPIHFRNIADWAGQPFPNTGFMSNLKILCGLELLSLSANGFVSLTAEGRKWAEVSQFKEKNSVRGKRLSRPQKRILAELGRD